MAVLLGRTSAGTNADNQLDGWTAVWRFQASATGSLAIIFAQTKVANAGVSAVKLGIYADIDINTPGALLASHAVDSLTAARGTGVFQATLTTPVAITSGTFYWLGWRGVGEAWDWQGDLSGAYFETSTDFPDPFSGGSAGTKNAIIWGEDAGAVFVPRILVVDTAVLQAANN